MLDNPEAVFEALRENNGRPYGLQRTVTAEELVEAAEALEKTDILATALLELMSAYEFTGEHRKAPVVFARLLKLWDTEPGAFSEWEAHQVFWRFKWVTTSLLQVPEVPLATIEGWIERMRGRYADAGHDMQPVAAMRYHVASHTGTGVADAYDLWATRPRCELSDCKACEVRQFAWHAVRAGDDATALEHWRPVLSGDEGCSDEPQTSQARALLPLLRTGRTDEARSHHLTGYRRVRGNTGMQDEIGMHLEFCALSRNEGRGLEVLAENRPLFEATGAPLSRLGFLTGVEVLLARIVGDGHEDTAVAGPPGRVWTAGALLAHVRAEGDRLGAAFDARNGTTGVGDVRRARLAQPPLLDEPLPLGLRTALPKAAAPAPSGTTPATAAGAPSVPEDFSELVREARRLTVVGHPGGTRLWRRVAERLDEGSATHDDRLGPQDLLLAELAEHRAYELSQEDHEDESAAELERSGELYDALGKPWHALALRAHAFARLTIGREGTPRETSAGAADPAVRRPDAAEIRATVDKTLRLAEDLKVTAPLTEGAPEEEAAGSGADTAAQRVQEYLVTLHACALAAHQATPEEDEDPEPESESDSVLEWAKGIGGTLRAEAERLSVPHQVAAARLFTADLAARREDLATAETEMRAALAELTAGERPWRAARVRARLAQILLARQEPAEAAELLHQAVADAVRYDDTDFPLAPTYTLLAHAASHMRDVTGAVRHFSEAADRYDRQGASREAVDVRLQLADVLARGGRQADAVAVLESVLSGLPEVRGDGAAGDDGRLTAHVRLTLARGLRELEEYLPAAEEFLRVADAVATWQEDREIHTMVAAEAATALLLADRRDAARTAYQRAVDAHAQAPNASFVVQMMCEFARLTVRAREAEGLDEALEHLTRADAVRAAVPQDDECFVPWYQSGAVHYRRARVLSEVERFPEALAEGEAAVAAYEEGGADGEVPRAEAVRITALIEGTGLGRYDDAIIRLSSAIDRCRAADLAEAARILDALRQDFRNRAS
ncbi:hypothetical protein ACFXPI_18385 [Streptomyces sp. NPDC059104]|uniref:hypothetical protein n=1 Tax=Streptomyces sp. NPDC059104 TaxID=3346729 RepID=UPI0036779CE4